MKKTKALLAIILVVLLCLTLSLAACSCEHEYVDGVCSKCGEPDPDYNPNPNPNPNPNQTPSKAVITVVPAEMTVTPDDEVVLLFGVSATLDGNEITVTIADDDGFDPDNMEEGVYTITYQAGEGESRATATRKITVEAPLSQLALEVRQNLLGEAKWQGKLLTFKNKLYKELTQDTTLTAQSGVFHNNSENAITLNVDGMYGCSAILDQNGVVLEGRDGANSKLVNAANPTRAGSSVTTITIDGEAVPVNNAFAKELVIPAGGYAVVIQQKYASEAGADFDGRGYINYNVIYQVGNVVRLYWVDEGVSEGLLTPYVNQAPYVATGNGTVYAQLNDSDFDLEAAVKGGGIIVKDDNGTFGIEDDVVLNDAITLTDNGGFDIAAEGSYTVTLTLSDGTASTTVTRKVEVKDSFIILTIDDKTLRVAPERFIYNQEVTASSAAKYGMIVLDKNYEGEFACNGFGGALVLNKYGQLVRIYDAANLGLWDKNGKADPTPFTQQNYATYAWENLGEGETLIICPNDGGTNEARSFALSLRPNVSKGYFGVICSLTGFTFEERGDVPTYGITYAAGEGSGEAPEVENYEEGETVTLKANTFTAPDGMVFAGWLVEGESEIRAAGTTITMPANALTITAQWTEAPDGPTLKIGDDVYEKNGELTIGINPNATAATEYDFFVYTTAFYGQLGYANGYGAAFVIGADNKIVRIYNGADNKYYDAENTAGITDAEKMTSGDYLIKAMLSLKNGEYLLVAPNAGGNSARNFLRSHCTIDAVVTIEGLETEITASTKDATALFVNNKYFYNPAAEMDKEVTNVSNLDFVYYSYGYSGIVLKNGWSEIFVVDVTTGKVVLMYDGVNGKYYDADNTAGISRTDDLFTLGDMSIQAFEALKPNQIMVIGLNGGRDNHGGRKFLLDNRVYNTDLRIEGLTITPASEEVVYMTITVGAKTWYQDMSKVALDAEYEGNPAFAIYHKGYEGALISNSHGEAFIVNAETGKVEKIFDGANAKYYDAENPDGVQNGTCSAAGYVSEAFAALEEGQYVIIATNGGTTGNVARGLLYGARSLNTIISYNAPETTNPDEGEEPEVPNPDEGETNPDQGEETPNA